MASLSKAWIFMKAGIPFPGIPVSSIPRTTPPEVQGLSKMSPGDEFMSDVGHSFKGRLAVKIEKRKTKMERTQRQVTRGYTRLEVFEKIAMKTDDHNHPKSLQYDTIWKLRRLKVKEERKT